MRGENGSDGRRGVRCHRFTPTCVGKIYTRCAPPRSVSVHPHVRGENLTRNPSQSPQIGSPPRAWGKYSKPIETSSYARFTPTCVGKIPLVVCCWASAAVHPHVRGENSTATLRPLARYGSPPRAWGKLGQLIVLQPVGRFTPTCVGKMSRGSCPPAAGPVHPHVRGENGRYSWR